MQFLAPIEGKIPSYGKVRTITRIGMTAGILVLMETDGFAPKKILFLQPVFCSCFGTTLNHKL